MQWYSIEPKKRKYAKINGFLSFARKYKKNLLNTELDAVKINPKKTGESLGNKTADSATNSNDDKMEKKRTYWRDNYSTRKKRWNIKKTEKSIVKMKHYKISKLINDTTVWKFVTKRLVEVNDLSSGQYSKSLMLRSDLCDYSDAYIVVKGRISVASNNVDNRRNKKLTFKNNAPLDHVFQKSITHLLTMQKILILLCQCIIC